MSDVAASSAFTYQGQLTDSGAPVSGSADFEFTLYDQLVGGVGAEQALRRRDQPEGDRGTPDDGTGTGAEDMKPEQAADPAAAPEPATRPTPAPSRR